MQKSTKGTSCRHFSRETWITYAFMRRKNENNTSFKWGFKRTKINISGLLPRNLNEYKEFYGVSTNFSSPPITHLHLPAAIRFIMSKNTKKQLNQVEAFFVQISQLSKFYFNLPSAVTYIVCELDVTSDNCKDVNLQNRPPLHKFKESSRSSDHV